MKELIPIHPRLNVFRLILFLCFFYSHFNRAVFHRCKVNDDFVMFRFRFTDEKEGKEGARLKRGEQLMRLDPGRSAIVSVKLLFGNEKPTGRRHWRPCSQYAYFVNETRVSLMENDVVRGFHQGVKALVMGFALFARSASMNFQMVI